MPKYNHGTIKLKLVHGTTRVFGIRSIFFPIHFAVKLSSIEIEFVDVFEFLSNKVVCTYSVVC